MKLSELIDALDGLSDAYAWSDPGHVREDPEVYLLDLLGGKHAIGEVRLDFAPLTLAEAEADIRHPVVELYTVLGPDDRTLDDRMHPPLRVDERRGSGGAA